MHLSEEGETFCVFFQRGWVEDIVRVTTTSSRRLLEEPEARHAHCFLEITTRDPGVLKAIGDLRTRVITETRGDLEPAILGLGEALVRSETSLRELARRVPAQKASTREELLRRLLRARDYAESSLSSPLALAAVAREAALSSYHLHRSFRQTFGETLHQFITRRRLETAASLLRAGERSVLEVCAMVGFESATSFTTLFRHHYGLPPARFRANSQDSRSHSLPARVRSRA